MRSGDAGRGAEPDLVIRARSMVLPDGVRPAAVGIRDGTIVEVLPYDGAVSAGETVVLGDDEVLLPGLVDTHVHVNEPGRTEWEGFATATRAAAAGRPSRKKPKVAAYRLASCAGCRSQPW